MVVARDVEFEDAWANPDGTRVAATAVTARTEPATRNGALFIMTSFIV
jgi:hypothetical protein